MADYHDIKVKKAVWTPIDRFLREHPEFGYSSTTDFFVKAAVAAFARLKDVAPAVPAEPVAADPPPPATPPPGGIPSGPDPSPRRGRTRGRHGAQGEPASPSPVGHETAAPPRQPSPDPGIPHSEATPTTESARPTPPAGGASLSSNTSLDLRAIRTYVESFAGQAKKWYKTDEDRREYLALAVQRAAKAQGVDLDVPTSTTILEKLGVEVK